MRKTFLLIFLTLAVIAFGQEITMLHSGDTVLGDSTLFKIAGKMLKADYPDVQLNLVKIDLSDGSTLTMDAMLAAGTAPNIYTDTMVRASKYMIPEFAAPLNKLVRDLNKYQPGILEPYKRNGQLLALPVPGGGQGMCINLDLMKAIGYKIPANWTIADFLRMAELVKQKYGGKKWATGMFAANQSGDYLINNWFASFGVSFYRAGNYDKSVIADTGGAKVYEFFQSLARSGYIPNNSATLNDDDYAAQWMVGDLAATAFFPNWTAGYFKTAMDQKLIEKPFAYSFVQFPRAPGVKKVPTYFSNGAMVVHNTGTYADKIAARFVEYINSAKLQGMLSKTVQVIANRTDVKEFPTDPRVGDIVAIIKNNGIMDVGLTDPRFTERRALQFPILQKVLNFAISPEAAIKEYQAKLSAVK